MCDVLEYELFGRISPLNPSHPYVSAYGLRRFGVLRSKNLPFLL